MTKKRHLDIVDIKRAVKLGMIEFYMEDGLIYCIDCESRECVLWLNGCDIE